LGRVKIWRGDQREKGSGKFPWEDNLGTWGRRVGKPFLKVIFPLFVVWALLKGEKGFPQPNGVPPK